MAATKKIRKAGKRSPAPRKPMRPVRRVRTAKVVEKRRPTEGLGIKAILVPIDFSEHSKNALK